MKISRDWSEVTIKQFQELSTLTNAGTIDYWVRLLTILSGKDIENEIKISEINTYIEKIRFTEHLPVNMGMPQILDVNGKQYRVTLGVEELTGGQYIDLMTLTKNSELMITNLHKILAVFIQPKEALKYTGIKHADEFLNHLTIDIAYPIAVFFCNFYNKLMPNIADFMLSQANKEIAELNKEVKKAMTN